MKSFVLIPDRNQRNTFARPAPDYVEAIVLAANTNQTIPVPAAVKDGFVVFSADGDFFAKPGGAAAVPSVTSTTGVGSELNPSIWSCDGVTQIGMIASATRIVTMSFYAK